MGIFPGAKSYFREKSGSFLASGLRGQARPTVIITDMMLLLYMFDAHVQRARARADATANAPLGGHGGVGTLRDLAHFLWERIAHPDEVAHLERWQTHVVTFDISGFTPRAKEATQAKRRERAERYTGSMRFGEDGLQDEPLPSPLSSVLREAGGTSSLVEALLPMFQRLYGSSVATQGEIIIQAGGGPFVMRKNGLDVWTERLMHVAHVADVGEGDLSVCFWVQYFNADSTLVLSKDTDMILLLSMVCPVAPKRLFLRLDYLQQVDYIDINVFKVWMQHAFGSYYDGFMYITLQVRSRSFLPSSFSTFPPEPTERGCVGVMLPRARYVQGNDYVNKVSKGISQTAMLDSLRKRPPTKGLLGGAPPRNGCQRDAAVGEGTADEPIRTGPGTAALEAPGVRACVRRLPDGTLELCETLILSRLRHACACVRGSCVPEAPVLVRQAWWYLCYALIASNGYSAANGLCVTSIGPRNDELHLPIGSRRKDARSLFGWMVNDEGGVVPARVAELASTPVMLLLHEDEGEEHSTSPIF